jgi:hypothetical protein
LLLYQTGRINGFQNIENRFSSSFLGKSFWLIFQQKIFLSIFWIAFST